ncbi:MAG: hypothetical protein Q4E22_00040 [Coriobacteriia bacterium]|nr:hypothetical protein [Coriobacteriia bacterium]
METNKDSARAYPLAAKIYGVFCILGGAITILSIVAFAFVLVSVFSGDFNPLIMEATGKNSLTTILIAAFSFIVSTALAVGFFWLGVVLLKGSTKKVASLA